jgi:lycopene beta-cyclase
MTEEYEIAFAGAGLSALSLAVRLAALPHPPRMVLIDPLHEPLRDRTWCHWRTTTGPFDAAITHRWNRWTVRAGADSTTIDSPDAPYVRIPSDRFHHLASGILAACPQVRFLRGVAVDSLEEGGRHVHLHLGDGRRLAASRVFDSRPPNSHPAPWRQIFRGLELHSPEASLDTTAATLMDFQSAGPEGIRFFYVLPLDPHTALVEDTWLVPQGIEPAFDDRAITDYATAHLSPATWQIHHREEGNLPMAPTPRGGGKTGRIIPWGTAAGAVRASSGYAFSRVQQASARMAAAWRENGRPSNSARHESPLVGWMDRVFLRVMDRHPCRMPDFFLRLFDRVPPAALVRFLESEPRPADILHVMRALPPTPFLAAALR